MDIWTIAPKGNRIVRPKSITFGEINSLNEGRYSFQVLY